MHKVNSMNEVRDRIQEGNDLEEAIKMIDSNTAISVPSLWLKVGDNGLPATNLGKTRSKR
jgi:hypothetical protein